jgi:hypothetical protein
VYELFVPLSFGGRVVLVKNILGLSSLPPQANVRLINTVPSAMAELLRSNAVPDSVMTVNLAGEPLSTELVSTIYQKTKAKRVYDLYGPSEDTTYSTCALRLPDRPATIGRPIAGTQVYVLDKYQQPVPVGVPGELYVGGAGLARGYINRPELTAERFISDIFSDEPGARLYRTGDLVRRLPDGNLEFLGRLDDQVKIRGFRIELGEIESCLRGHPAVQDAAVAAREDTPGEKRLVAYVVLRGREAGVGELRRYLEEKLPQYMIPSAFVRMERLPLTSNGKLDRRALPAPDHARPESGTAYVPPRDTVEEQLAAIWADVLGIGRVGVHDNFFEIGGHSLLAAGVAGRIQDRMGARVPISAIFRHPTIAALASQLDAEAGNTFDMLEPIRPAGGAATVLCFGLGMSVIQQLQDYVPDNHPLYWYKQEHIDGKRLRYFTVHDLAAHYCRELRLAGLRGPYVLLGFSFGGLVALETARQLSERGEVANLAFLLEPAWPGDPGSLGERLHRRIRVFRSSSSERKLLYLYHKLVRRPTRYLKKRLTNLYCQSRLACGLRVPVGMRLMYAEDAYLSAIAQYVPQAFPGRVVLVRSLEYSANDMKGLTSIAGGGLTLHESCSPDHLDLVTNKEVIAQWGDLLRRHLRSPGAAP